MDVTPQRTSSTRRKYLAALARGAGGRRDGYDSDEYESPKEKDLSDLAGAGNISTTYVVSWVAPSPDMWYLDDRGRESWDWDGQHSAIWQASNSREAGVVQSRC